MTSRSAPFQAALAGIDVLSINRAEADVLIPQLASQFREGGPVPPIELDGPTPELVLLGLRSGGHEMSLAHLMAAFNTCGVGHVVITNGADGAYVGDGRQIIHCPAHSVEIAGTAGGGDAFASTFAAWLVLGQDAVQALKAATLNSAYVIGHADTQTGLLPEADLKRQVAEVAGDFTISVWQVGTS